MFKIYPFSKSASKNVPFLCEREMYPSHFSPFQIHRFQNFPVSFLIDVIAFENSTKYRKYRFWKFFLKKQKVYYHRPLLMFDFFLLSQRFLLVNFEQQSLFKSTGCWFGIVCKRPVLGVYQGSILGLSLLLGHYLNWTYLPLRFVLFCHDFPLAHFSRAKTFFRTHLTILVVKWKVF